MINLTPLPLAVNALDQLNWEIQNGFRRMGEWFEWQWDQLFRQNDWQIQSPPSWLDQFVLWLVRGLGVGLLLILVAWTFQRLSHWLHQRRATSSVSERLESNPLAPQWSVEDWLSQARQARGQEDYAQACRALYMALILRLEQSGYLLRSPASTNGEHLQTLASRWALEAQPPSLTQTWQLIFYTHEQSFYGAQPITAEIYANCERAYQTLSPQLRPLAAQS